MPKRKQSDCVFVLYYCSHVDCYKRAESFATVVGVFREESAAVMKALKDNVFVFYGDENLDECDKNVTKFIQKKTIPKLEKDRKLLFDSICKMKLDQRGNFTMQASGNYVEIKSVKIK